MILDPLRELYARYPFFGLKIQATVIQSDVSALLGEGRGFLELAEELNLPFIIHSSVAPAARRFVYLRSTYAEEAACLHALPDKLKPAASQDNRLALLQLKDANLLSRR